MEFFRRFGNPIYYGDPTKPELLRSAGAEHIRLFVVAMGSVEDSLRTVRLIRRFSPDAKILARARDRRHAWQLMDFGVTPIRETFFSALKTGREALITLGFPPEIADDRMRRFKEADERMLSAQHLVYDDEEALKQTSAEARKELEQLFAADQGEGLLGSVVREDVELPAVTSEGQLD